MRDQARTAVWYQSINPTWNRIQYLHNNERVCTSMHSKIISKPLQWGRWLAIHNEAEALYYKASVFIFVCLFVSRVCVRYERWSPWAEVPEDFESLGGGIFCLLRGAKCWRGWVSPSRAKRGSFWNACILTWIVPVHSELGLSLKLWILP